MFKNRLVIGTLRVIRFQVTISFINALFCGDALFGTVSILLVLFSDQFYKFNTNFQWTLV